MSDFQAYPLRARYHQGCFPTTRQWIKWYLMVPVRRLQGWKPIKDQFKMPLGTELAGPHRIGAVHSMDVWLGGYYSNAAFNCGYREYRRK